MLFSSIQTGRAPRSARLVTLELLNLEYYADRCPSQLSPIPQAQPKSQTPGRARPWQPIGRLKVQSKHRIAWLSPVRHATTVPRGWVRDTAPLEMWFLTRFNVLKTSRMRCVRHSCPTLEGFPPTIAIGGCNLYATRVEEP